MNKVIFYRRPDGGVDIVHPAPQARNAHEREDAFLQRIAAKDVPEDASDVRIVDCSDIPPTYRDYRNALRANVTFDMAQCRAIHRDKLRTARRPLLEALDVEYMRADETDDKDAKAQIAKRKQALREVTVDPAIDAAATIEDLSACWPAALKS